MTGYIIRPIESPAHEENAKMLDRIEKKVKRLQDMTCMSFEEFIARVEKERGNENCITGT
jgi:hypothetical protein